MSQWRGNGSPRTGLTMSEWAPAVNRINLCWLSVSALCMQLKRLVSVSILFNFAERLIRATDVLLNCEKKRQSWSSEISVAFLI